MNREFAHHVAMKWLQSLSEAFETGVITASDYVTNEQAQEIHRELELFAARTLPQLHEALGTDPDLKATYHLHFLGVDHE